MSVMNLVRPAALAVIALATLFACSSEDDASTTASSTTASSTGGQGGSSASAGGSGGGTSNCVTDGSIAPPNEGVSEFTISQMIEGQAVDRRVIVHAPGNIGGEQCLPVYFFLHGNGGQPDMFVGRNKMMVEAGNFVGIYPEGHLKSWNLGKEDSKADDVAFITSVTDKLKSDYGHLNHGRRYLYGNSNGAALSHRLAIETSLFRAFVAVVSGLTTQFLPDQNSSQPAVMQILGENDPLIPYEGGKGVAGHEFLSGEKSAETWATHNQCGKTPEVTTTDDGNKRIRYTSCANGGEVIHYMAAGAEHNIPSQFEGGLSALTWAFVSAH